MTTMTDHQPITVEPDPDGLQVDQSVLDTYDAWLTHLASLGIEVEPVVYAVLAAAPEGRFKKEDDWERDSWVVQTAKMLDALDRSVVALKKMRDDVAADLARKVPFQTSLIAVEGLPAMEPHFGGNRTQWKNEDLQADVKPRVLHDQETGERLDGEAVLERILSVVSLIGSNVKTTGLRALGLDPNDYSFQAPKDPTIQIVRPK